MGKAKGLGGGPKFFVIDNIDQLINFNYYGSLFEEFSDNMNANNGVFVSTVNVDSLVKLDEAKVPMAWLDKV